MEDKLEITIQSEDQGDIKKNTYQLLGLKTQYLINKKKISQKKSFKLNKNFCQTYQIVQKVDGKIVFFTQPILLFSHEVGNCCSAIVSGFQGFYGMDSNQHSLAKIPLIVMTGQRFTAFVLECSYSSDEYQYQKIQVADSFMANEDEFSEVINAFCRNLQEAADKENKIVPEIEKIASCQKKNTDNSWVYAAENVLDLVLGDPLKEELDADLVIQRLVAQQQYAPQEFATLDSEYLNLIPSEYRQTYLPGKQSALEFVEPVLWDELPVEIQDIFLDLGICQFKSDWDGFDFDVQVPLLLHLFRERPDLEAKFKAFYEETGNDVTQSPFPGYTRQGDKSKNGKNGAGNKGGIYIGDDGLLCLHKKDTDKKSGQINKDKVFFEPFVFRLILEFAKIIYPNVNVDSKISVARHIKEGSDPNNEKGCETTYVQAVFFPENRGDFWKMAFKDHYRERYKYDIAHGTVGHSSFDRRSEGRLKKLKKRLIGAGVVCKGMLVEELLQALIKHKMEGIPERPTSSVGLKAEKIQRIYQNYLEKKPHLKESLVNFSMLALLFGNLGVHPGNWGIAYPYRKIRFVSSDLTPEQGGGLEKNTSLLYICALDEPIASYKAYAAGELIKGRALDIEVASSLMSRLSQHHAFLGEETPYEIDENHVLFEEIISAFDLEYLTMFDYGTGGFNLDKTDFNPFDNSIANTGFSLQDFFKHHFFEYGLDTVLGEISALAAIKLGSISREDQERIIRDVFSAENINPFFVASDLTSVFARMKMPEKNSKKIRKLPMEDIIVSLQNYLIDKIGARSGYFKELGIQLLLVRHCRKNSDDEITLDISEFLEYMKGYISEENRGTLFSSLSTPTEFKKTVGRAIKALGYESRIPSDTLGDIQADKDIIRDSFLPVELSRIELTRQSGKVRVALLTLKDGRLFYYKKNTDPECLTQEFLNYDKIFPGIAQLISDAGRHLGIIIPYQGSSLDLKALKLLSIHDRVDIFAGVVGLVEAVHQKGFAYDCENMQLGDFSIDRKKKISLVDCENVSQLDDEKDRFQLNFSSLITIVSCLFEKDFILRQVLETCADFAQLNDVLANFKGQFNHATILKMAPSFYERIKTQYVTLMIESKERLSNMANTHAALLLQGLDGLELHLQKKCPALGFTVGKAWEESLQTSAGSRFLKEPSVTLGSWRLFQDMLKYLQNLQLIQKHITPREIDFRAKVDAKKNNFFFSSIEKDLFEKNRDILPFLKSNRSCYVSYLNKKGVKFNQDQNGDEWFKANFWDLSVVEQHFFLLLNQTQSLTEGDFTADKLFDLLEEKKGVLEEIEKKMAEFEALGYIEKIEYFNGHGDEQAFMEFYQESITKFMQKKILFKEEIEKITSVLIERKNQFFEKNAIFNKDDFLKYLGFYFFAFADIQGFSTKKEISIKAVSALILKVFSDFSIYQQRRVFLGLYALIENKATEYSGRILSDQEHKMLSWMQKLKPLSTALYYAAFYGKDLLKVLKENNLNLLVDVFNAGLFIDDLTYRQNYFNGLFSLAICQNKIYLLVAAYEQSTAQQKKVGSTGWVDEFQVSLADFHEISEVSLKNLGVIFLPKEEGDLTEKDRLWLTWNYSNSVYPCIYSKAFIQRYNVFNVFKELNLDDQGALHFSEYACFFNALPGSFNGGEKRYPDFRLEAIEKFNQRNNQCSEKEKLIFSLLLIVDDIFLNHVDQAMFKKEIFIEMSHKIRDIFPYLSMNFKKKIQDLYRQDDRFKKIIDSSKTARDQLTKFQKWYESYESYPQQTDGFFEEEFNLLYYLYCDKNHEKGIHFLDGLNEIFQDDFAKSSRPAFIYAAFKQSEPGIGKEWVIQFICDHLEITKNPTKHALYCFASVLDILLERANSEGLKSQQAKKIMERIVKKKNVGSIIAKAIEEIALNLQKKEKAKYLEPIIQDKKYLVALRKKPSANFHASSSPLFNHLSLIFEMACDEQQPSTLPWENYWQLPEDQNYSDVVRQYFTFQIIQDDLRGDGWYDSKINSYLGSVALQMSRKNSDQVDDVLFCDFLRGVKIPDMPEENRGIIQIDLKF